MKIARVDAFAIGMEPESRVAPGRDQDEYGDHYIARDEWTSIYSRRLQTSLVRIETDDGVVGWGEGQAPVSPRTAKTIIDDLCRPVVLGQDPFDVEYIWYRLYSAMRERGHITGFYVDALAAIDLALYDVLGKVLGLPAHRLLGGRFRERVPVYVGIRGSTPDVVAAAATEHVGYGYRALKLHLRPPNPELLEMVKAARAAVGDEIVLMVAVHTTRDVSLAIELGRGLEELGVRWLESPTAPEDEVGHAEIARALDMQIASGEWLRTAWEWRRYIAARSVDVAMPDIARTGLTEGKRIAGLCDASNIPVAPHVGGGGILSVAASVQFSAAIPNLQILEHSHHPHARKGLIATRYPEPEDGSFAAGDEPGLGVEIDEAAVARYAL